MLLRFVLGPFWYLRSAPLRGLLLLLLVVLLTPLTQTGGLLLWLSPPVLAWIGRGAAVPGLGAAGALGAFLAVYLVINLTSGFESLFQEFFPSGLFQQPRLVSGSTAASER